MKFKVINDSNILNKFVYSQAHSQFLQSWEWGRFQTAAGQKVVHLGIEDQNQLIAVMSLTKKQLSLNKSYFYSSRGPLVSLGIRSKKFEVIGLMFDMVKDIAKKEDVLFLRFEPTLDISTVGRQIVKTIDVQPSKTIMTDLRSSESEILENMHKKTRYNIRLSEKRGVKIKEANLGTESGEFENFWKLMSETVKRDNFRLHNKEYYRTMLDQEKNTEPPEPPADVDLDQGNPLRKKLDKANQVNIPAVARRLRIKLYF